MVAKKYPQWWIFLRNQKKTNKEKYFVLTIILSTSLKNNQKHKEANGTFFDECWGNEHSFSSHSWEKMILNTIFILGDTSLLARPKYIQIQCKLTKFMGRVRGEMPFVFCLTFGTSCPKYWNIFDMYSIFPRTIRCSLFDVYYFGVRKFFIRSQISNMIPTRDFGLFAK